MQQKKQFLSKLKRLSHSRSMHRLFSDWLEVAAISIHQLPYHSGELPKDESFDLLEADYLKTIEPYNKDELIVFSELLSLTLSAHDNNYSDFL